MMRLARPEQFRLGLQPVFQISPGGAASAFPELVRSPGHLVLAAFGAGLGLTLHIYCCARVHDFVAGQSIWHGSRSIPQGGGAQFCRRGRPVRDGG
jgi:hypothetical protein